MGEGGRGAGGLSTADGRSQGPQARTPERSDRVDAWRMLATPFTAPAADPASSGPPSEAVGGSEMHSDERSETQQKKAPPHRRHDYLRRRRRP